MREKKRVGARDKTNTVSREDWEGHKGGAELQCGWTIVFSASYAMNSLTLFYP